MLVLSRDDVYAALTLLDCIAAVEGACRLHAEGETLGPGVLGIRATDGGFHIKAAGLVGERRYFAAKTNANFPENPERFGMPTIQGTVVLADAVNGTPLAVMESGSITAIRTGAATGVAAKYLARKDARIATIVACRADAARGDRVRPVARARAARRRERRARGGVGGAGGGARPARRGRERRPRGGAW